MSRPITSFAVLLFSSMILSTSAAAAAQVLKPLTSPVPTGRYEGYSPLLAAPYGPISPVEARMLPRWLDVVTQGSSSTITMRPEGRVVWELTYGPHGLERKKTLVDGALWTDTTFTFDAQGRWQYKDVAGPGLGGQDLRDVFEVDAQGRIVSRKAMAQVGPTKQWQVDAKGVSWHVVHTRRGATTAWKRGGELLREDTFDARGYPTRVDFGSALGAPLMLKYKRNAQGRLSGLSWQIDKRRGDALNQRKPRGTASSRILNALTRSVMERHEVLLLLGPPVLHRDDAKGTSRRTHDEYADDCWLNEVSGLDYDAAGLLKGGSADCICGFCVDAALPIDAVAVNGEDLHWTAGPWYRLDHAVDVTGDHKIMTPGGPVPVEQLKAGDLVLRDDGRIKVLESVLRLPHAERRLGRNVRTEAGVFAAGGFLFESERAVMCPSLR